MTLTFAEKNRLAQKRYRNTENGKLAIKKYQKTKKRKRLRRGTNDRYRKTEKGKSAQKRASAKYSKSKTGIEARVRHRDKIQTRHVLYNAIRAGRLIRGPCQNCGAVENVEGHHDDYRQPLVVIWLCGGCHRLRHN